MVALEISRNELHRETDIKSIKQFAELLTDTSETSWRDKIFQIGRELGYGHTMLAILPSHDAKPEPRAAYVQTNYSSAWQKKYEDEKMGYFDPKVAHAMTKSIPLILTPDVFATLKQKEMYEEACAYGLRSGITLPMHGPTGELGMICFASDLEPDDQLEQEIMQDIPKLSYLRDFICESSQRFTKWEAQNNHIELTQKELECLKWSATGKSAWDIGQIMNLGEAGVNKHFANIRRKFGTTTRCHAIVKAIRMGLISPF